MAKMAQFLMPDGRTLASVLKSDVDSQSDIFHHKKKQSKTTKRGKDLQFAFVVKSARVAMAHQYNAVQGQNLAELRTLESVGCRRRRRWLNDRILREVAGPMTAADIEREFQPVPFGYQEPSAFEIITQPQHSSIWDGFRNIDPDKEERVLQRWAEHNRELRRAARQQGKPLEAGEEGEGGPSVAVKRAGATEALQRWGRVSRKARQALRKANLHSVHALESQILDMLEGGAARALQFRGLDGWGRLLVHGLADFYGLASSSSRTATRSSTATFVPNPHSTATDTEEDLFDDVIVIDHSTSGGVDGLGGLQSVSEEEQEEGTKGAAQQGTEEEPAVTIWHRATVAEVVPMPPPELTCVDVMMALEEVGTGSVSAKQLHEYMRKHVHGSDVSRAESWVVL